MLYPQINPIALSVGSFSLHWYGIMFVLAFLCAWGLARFRASRSGCVWNAADVDDMMLVGMIGVVAGGRIGYMLFYNFQWFVRDPLELVRLWNGGMSFHGGLLGVIIALWWWAWRQQRTFLSVMDFVAPLVPAGLFFGRIGNFINNELWGAPTTLPWGMAEMPGGVLRHPSQLYEAVFEGLVLFVLVWIYSVRPRPAGRVAGLFALGYGIARFGVEFVRLPDAHIGYLAFGWLTMGQVLTLPLLVAGAWLFWRAVPVTDPADLAIRPATRPATSKIPPAKPAASKGTSASARKSGGRH